MAGNKNQNLKALKVFAFFGFLILFSFFLPNGARADSCPNVYLSGDVTITASCKFSEAVDGADGGGIIINADADVTMDQDQIIVWALGSNLTINGSIILNKTPGHGSQLKKTKIWLVDADGDGYPDKTAIAADSAPANGYRRGDSIWTSKGWNYTSNIEKDYNDLLNTVYPGQPCEGACTKNELDGSCGLAAADTDPGSLCTGLDCSGYYYGWAGSGNNTCYYRANVTATDHVCDGAGACKTAATQCLLTGIGNATAVTRTACHTATGCSGTTPGDVSGHVTDGSDTSSDCPGLDCDGGSTKYYSGWVSNTCYYKADVNAASHVCDGAGACKTAAVQCVTSSQGASTGVTRTACKSQVGCTGTTVGSLTPVASGSDTYSDCSGLDCDGGATKYYSGWVSNVCYYKADVSAADHVCDGASACKTAAVQCAASSQGASTGVTRTACKSQVGCTGTTVGSLGNIADNVDTYSECTASYNACSGNNRIGPDGYCDGAGACDTNDQSSACTTAGTCQAGGGCSAGSCVAVTNQTTAWSAGTYSCAAPGRCVAGSCETCGGVLLSDNCGGCAGQGGNACWTLTGGGEGVSCDTACAATGGGCVQEQWNDSATCNNAITLYSVSCSTSCNASANSGAPWKSPSTGDCIFRETGIEQTCATGNPNVYLVRACVCKH